MFNVVPSVSYSNNSVIAFLSVKKDFFFNNVKVYNDIFNDVFADTLYTDARYYLFTDITQMKWQFETAFNTYKAKDKSKIITLNDDMTSTVLNINRGFNEMLNYNPTHIFIFTDHKENYETKSLIQAAFLYKQHIPYQLITIDSEGVFEKFDPNRINMEKGKMFV